MYIYIYIYTYILYIIYDHLTPFAESADTTGV